MWRVNHRCLFHCRGYSVQRRKEGRRHQERDPPRPWNVWTHHGVDILCHEGGLHQFIHWSITPFSGTSLQVYHTDGFRELWEGHRCSGEEASEGILLIYIYRFYLKHQIHRHRYYNWVYIFLYAVHLGYTLIFRLLPQGGSVLSWSRMDGWF
jgi:hypothetical protein